MNRADTAKAAATDRDAAGSTRRRWIVSVFGDITRAGTWSPHQRLAPVSLFGDIDLDLRHVTQRAGGVTITAVAPFGNLDVLVPDGCQVDIGGFTLFGSKRISVPEATSGASAPVVRVRGFTLFGSIKVWSSGGPD
jgi:predicted membrane protein